MTSTHPTVHELVEYVPKLLAKEAIAPEIGESLWQSYGVAGVIEVDFPTPITGNQWKFTSQGWVGYIPLSHEFGIRLQPKVKLENLFGMLEYAYDLKSFHLLEGWSHCDVLEDFYERLANILAKRISDRARKGVYRAYVPRCEQMTYVRGRMDVKHLVQKPWEVAVKCHYKEQTPDIEDNQILLWTLRRIAQTGVCRPDVLANVRRAYHALQGTVSLEPCTAQACIKRFYNRLNHDYQPLHALCRFFLEQSGPNHEMGDRKMLPFLVDMARLYELFVAEWFKAHLAEWTAKYSTDNPELRNLEVKAQHTVYLDSNKFFSFNIDLVLEDSKTKQAQYVMDTKYKTPDKPSLADVAQIIAYATTKGCSEAVLIYPKPLQIPLDIKIQDIRVRTLTFAIAQDLKQGGQAFLKQLFST